MNGKPPVWKAKATATFAALISMKNEALLLLGGDLGDVCRTLDLATEALAARAGTVLARSRDHWTLPWGFAGNGLFLNRAVLLNTDLGPQELMDMALSIEKDLGRVRNNVPGYSSRTVDIDILTMADKVIDTPGLVLPHPRMHERAFALAPAADVAPSAIHPLLHRSVLQLLNDLRQRTV